MKEVISTFEESIRRIQDVNGDKIYAFKADGVGIYKLTYANDRWVFDYLGDSRTFCRSYSESTIRDAMHNATKDFTVYEFDNLKEFAEWLVKETK